MLVKHHNFLPSFILNCSPFSELAIKFAYVYVDTHPRFIIVTYNHTANHTAFTRKCTFGKPVGRKEWRSKHGNEGYVQRHVDTAMTNFHTYSECSREVWEIDENEKEFCFGQSTFLTKGFAEKFDEREEKVSAAYCCFFSSFNNKSEFQGQ